MIRRLLKDSVFYSLSAAIPAATGLLLTPIYTRNLGPREYGLLDATTVILALVGAVVALEISQGVARFLPEADTTEARRRIGSTAFWFTAGVFGSAAIAMWIASPWIARAWLGAPAHPDVVRAAALAMLTGGLQGVAVRHLRWSLRARSYVTTVAVANLVTAGLGVLLVLRWRPAAEALFWGQTGGNLAGLVLAWFLSGRELGWICDFVALKRMLRFSTPLVISTLGVIATSQLGRLMLARLGTLEDAGIFGIAGRLAGILGLLASGMQLAIGPLIYAAHEKADTPAALASALRIFAAMALIGWMALVAFSPELLRLLTAPSFASASGLIAPLAGAIVLSNSLTFAAGLEIKHRTSVVALISVFSGAINLLLCWLLIETHGSRGAATATLLAGTIQAALIFWLSQKHYPVPYPWRPLGFAIMTAVGTVAISQFCFPSGDNLLFAKIGFITLASLLVAGITLRPFWRSTTIGHPQP